jgi:hypothetical protein
MMDREPTRAELTEQLSAERAAKASLEERLARLEALVSAAPPAPAMNANEALLAAAIEELQRLRPQAAHEVDRPKGPAPKLVAYKGLVRAITDCAYGGYRHGPKEGVGGDVFEVDLPTLWSDDPFEPVTIKGEGESGQPLYARRTDVPILDWRWRVRGDASTMMARAV